MKSKEFYNLKDVISMSSKNYYIVFGMRANGKTLMSNELYKKYIKRRKRK